jgi:tetratricopeptide (TPR) repeat protein
MLHRQAQRSSARGTQGLPAANLGAAALTLILLLALVARLLSFAGGAETTYAEHEPLRAATAAERTGWGAFTPLPENPADSSLLTTLLAAVLPLAVGSGGAEVAHSLYTSDPGRILLVLRLACLVIGVLGAGVVAAGAARFAGRRAGWFAGALTAISPFWVEKTVHVGPEGLSLLCSAAALWQLVEHARTGRFRHALAAGAAIGLAGAAASDGLALLIALPLAGRGATTWRRVPGWLAALPVAAVTLALGAPAFVHAPLAVLTRAPAFFGAGLGAAGPPLGSAAAALRMLVGWLPFLLALLGVAAAARRGRSCDRTLIVATLAVAFVALWRGGTAPSAYAAAAPGLLLLAALGWSESGLVLWREPSRQELQVAAGIVLAFALAGTLRTIVDRWTPTPREQAGRWIRNHVPPGWVLLLQENAVRVPTLARAAEFQRLAGRGVVSEDRAREYSEEQSLFQVVPLPPREAADEEVALFYDPNLARFFPWLVLQDEPPPGARLAEPARELRGKFGRLFRVGWSVGARFEGSAGKRTGITILERPAPESDMLLRSSEAGLYPQMVEILGGPEVSAVRDTSRVFAAWLLEAGASLRSIGELEGAEVFLTLAKERDSENAEVYFQLAEVQLLHEALDEAKELLLTALSREPFHGRAHYELGTILDKEGDFAGAEVEYKAAILTLTEDVILLNAHARLGELLVRRGDISGARQQLELIRQVDPEGGAAKRLASVLGES